MIAIFLLVTSLWAQSNSLDTTSIDMRTPDQIEEPPNEPPFTSAVEAEATLENERNLEEEFEEPQSERIPRWKQQRRRLPDESRLKELNKEKGLFKITKKNEFLYEVKKSPQTNGFSFRFGTLSLTNLTNETAGYSYDDIYGDSTSITLFADWEWQFFKKLGKLGLKIGSGLSMSQGNGKWAAGSPNDTGSKEPLENYSFYLMPNSLSAIYRADFFHNQIIVPYGEGGMDYFTFGELRDDGEFKYGGAPAWHVAVGLALSLNWINTETMVRLDKEQGINTIYLVAEYRIITGMSDKFDFTDNVINGGFFVEY